MTMATTTTLTSEITELLNQMYAAFDAGDPTPWAGRMARHHEPVGIGTDASEFWVGRDKLAEVTAAQLREMSAAGITFTPTQIRAGSQGDVAWAVDEPTLLMPDGTRLPLRLTVVAVKEEGELRWTHFHLSTPTAANTEVLDLDLST
jgi:hypothetical protein